MDDLETGAPRAKRYAGAQSRALLLTVQQVLAALLMMVAATNAQQPSPPSSIIPQTLDDAWWTGPLLAPSAATLARGHLLVEPYLYDVIGQGRYDASGVRRRLPHSNGYGSLAYIVYGLRDRISVGLIPIVSYNTVIGGPSSSGLRLGDLTVQAQYRLTQFHLGSWLPTTSIAVQETFPTGTYDRLNRATDGFGTGAYTTTLGVYSQTYFWLPNGRIIRMRLNVSQTFSARVNVEGMSVYGTNTGFRGRAAPAGSLFVDAAWEYSLTRSWVLALDATYAHDGNTRVKGYDTSDSADTRSPIFLQSDSGSSQAFGLAPAIEYNWEPNLGVIVGVRVIPVGRNTAATITPAIAINFVH